MEWRLFGGLELEEIVELEKISRTRLRRECKAALAFLRREYRYRCLFDTQDTPSLKGVRDTRQRPWSKWTFAALAYVGILIGLTEYPIGLSEAQEELRKINEKAAPASLEMATNLNDLGRLAYRHDDWEQAAEYYEGALEILQKLVPGSLEVAKSLNDLGRVAYQRDDWERAAEYHEQALKIRQKLAPDTLVVAWSLYRLGRAAYQRDDWERAAEYHEGALKIRQKLAPDSLVVAWSLYRLGSVAYQRADWELAAEYLDRALKIRQKLAPDSSVMATSLYSLGTVAYKRAAWERADEYYEGALKIRQKLAPDSLVVATTLESLGKVASKRNDWKRAAEYFMRDVKIRQKLAPDSLEMATSLDNLGLAAFNRNDWKWAAEYFEGALEIRQKLAPSSLDVAKSLESLGAVAHETGDLDRVAEYNEEALMIRQRLAPGSLVVATSLENLGAVAHETCDLVRAAEYYEGALEIRQKLAPGSLVVATSLNRLGLVALTRGDLVRAAEYHERAVKIHQKLAPSSLEMTGSLSLAALAHQRDDSDQAAKNIEKLELIYQKSAPVSRERLVSLAILTLFAIRRDDSDQVAKYIEELEALHRKSLPDSRERVASLFSLGTVAGQRGDMERAARHLERSLEEFQKLAPSSLLVADNLEALGYLAIHRNDLERATEYYERSLEIFQRWAPGSSMEAKVLYNLATLRRKQGQRQPALALYLQALQALENQVDRLGGSRDVQAGFRAEYVEFYSDTFDLLLELQQPEEAFHILERSRARSFLAQLAERDLVFSDIPEELDQNRRRVAVLYDRTQQGLAELSLPKDKEEIEALRAKLRQLQGERDDVEEKIRRDFPHLAALKFPQPLDLRQTQQVLDPGTVLLSYSIGEETTDLFVVARGGLLEVHSLPIGEEALTVLVRGFQSATHERGWSSRTASHLKHARLLYDILVEPAAAAVEKSERVMIIPDGPLHLLPFAALIRESDIPLSLPGPGGEADSERVWHYLVEWKPIHSVLSATVYAELRKSRRPTATPGSGAPIQLAAFGDPLYPGDLAETRHGDVYFRAATERGLDFPALPFTRREIQGIAEHYPSEDVRIYLGAEATEERVKSISGDTRILHFATHGSVDDRIPLNSFVALTIPKEHAEERENGLLQAWEIFEQVRLDADLVVLSACQSALGKELKGEGLIGLTRAFQYAGARTVGATLWRVADQATAELMIRFYRHLRAGKSKDVALQAAQIELIRNPIQVRDETGQTVEMDASAPYYWAAFQLFGDWQ